jgi:hypothetical protein
MKLGDEINVWGKLMSVPTTGFLSFSSSSQPPSLRFYFNMSKSYSGKCLCGESSITAKVDDCKLDFSLQNLHFSLRLDSNASSSRPPTCLTLLQLFKSLATAVTVNSPAVLPLLRTYWRRNRMSKSKETSESTFPRLPRATTLLVSTAKAVVLLSPTTRQYVHRFSAFATSEIRD